MKIRNYKIDGDILFAGDQEYSKNRDETYDHNGFIIETITYKMGGLLNNRTTYKYNSKGVMTDMTIFQGNGTIGDGEKCKFDEKGNLVEKIINTGRDGYETFTYKYDEKGKILECTRVNKTISIIQKTTNRYSDEGNIVETKECRNGICNRYIYSMDSLGNIIKNLQFDRYNTLIQTIKFEYNSNGKMVKEERIYENEDNIMTITYVYDEQGNKIEEHKTNTDGNLDIKISWEFTYDEKNNWIERIEFINDVPLLITEREIQYFD